MVGASHRDAGLDGVARLSSPGAERLREILLDHEAAGASDAADCGISGAVVLATCNRLEVYLDAEDPARAATLTRRVLARATGLDVAEVERLTGVVAGEAAVHHLFEVASGLDAMAVGEREIAGQIRRALAGARSAGLTTPLLERAFQHASRTSREVAVATDVSRTGASVASIALDLVGRPLAGARVLLAGTGSYASIVLAALRSRGVAEVMVWSATGGRGAWFAARHAASAVTDLATALRRADLVVTCHGTGAAILDAATVAACRPARARTELVVVDLALNADVDPAVGELDGVRLIDLRAVHARVPAAATAEIVRARQIVDQGVRRFAADLAGRVVDEIVVALRAKVEAAVDEEIGRLPAGGEVSASAATRALRRLAARLLHTPTALAHDAARQGRAAEHLRAFEQVLGVSVPLAEKGRQ